MTGIGVALPADGVWRSTSTRPARAGCAVAPGDRAGRIRVGYAAGLAAGWSGLPAPLAQGVVLLAAICSKRARAGGAPPAAVAALWRPWRRVRLEAARRSA